MWDENSQARLTQVHPKLSQLVTSLHDQLEKEGIVIRVTQAFRSYEEQEKLYNQGRTTPGPIVTNAKPGSSWHNYGLAVDVCPFDAQGQPDWNVDHPSWKRIVEVGISLGLFSGTQFHSIKDTPHFQLTGSFPASPTDDVRSLYESSGLPSVWAAAFPTTPAADPDGEIAV